MFQRMPATRHGYELLISNKEEKKRPDHLRDGEIFGILNLGSTMPENFGLLIFPFNRVFIFYGETKVALESKACKLVRLSGFTIAIRVTVGTL